MKKFKRWWYLNILNHRIFWNYYIDEEANGYYYYWENLIIDRVETVFAGYKLRALISPKNSFKTVKQRLRENDSATT